MTLKALLKKKKREIHTYCQLSQIPVAGEVIEPKGEPTADIFLSGYSFQLYSKYLLFPGVSVVIFHQWSLFLYQYEAIIESHNT